MKNIIKFIPSLLLTPLQKLTNVRLCHHVMSMQDVTTQKVLTFVHVILGTVVTDLHAMVGDMIH